ncbi:glyoxalase/bleomycin resistance/extradiol dioxygenase family protein [Candidatus Woesearchaeota archaeon]|nr:glyoxalase/bleomycin resistance/extradiol dioxygenase family protein [Candidatus Woesearchaeota archaeon]
MPKQIFVNLAVKDLNKTIEFFTKLGFKFNPQFTDENATCMIIGKDMFAMLLLEKFFKSFIPGKEIADAKKSTEALIALAVESRPKVDEMIKKVIDAGGKEYRQAQDHGWMYGRAFEDINWHIWEIFYMDESKMPEEMKKKTL